MLNAAISNTPIETSGWYFGSTPSMIEQALPVFFADRAVELLSPFLKMALAYGLPLGDYPLLSDSIYASCKEVRGMGAGSRLESHRKYCDIHIPIRGHDLIGIAFAADIAETEAAPYDAAADVSFYSAKPALMLFLPEKTAAIIPPAICHAPLSHSEPVTKLVIKIDMMYTRPFLKAGQRQ